MQLGTCHSGHPAPGRGSAPLLSGAPVPLARPAVSVASVSCLCGLCVSAFSLNSQLSTVNSEISAQPPYFHNLPHSSTTAQNSALYFHNLTNPFSRSSFILITIQIPRGVVPPRSTGTLAAFVSTTCAKRLKPIHLRSASLTAQGRFSTVSHSMEKRCEFYL